MKYAICRTVALCFVVSFPCFSMDAPDEKIRQWRKEHADIRQGDLGVLENAASKGDMRALYLLYLELENYRYAYKNRFFANRVGALIEEKSNQGDGVATSALCYMRMRGIGGIEKSTSKVIATTCERAINLGVANAKTILGYFLRENSGSEKMKGVQLIKEAAEAGDPSGMRLWGDYLDKNGNYEEAEIFAKKAADAGDADAMNNIARLLHSKKDKSNFDKITYYYNKAIKAGNLNALVNFGDLYARGDVVEKNIPMAMGLFSRAAGQGSREAYNWLGIIYRDGLNGVVDKNVAIEKFSIAAKMDYPPAMNNLGMLLLYKEDGRLVDQPYQAVEWIKKSALHKNPSPEGTASLGILYKNGIGVERNFDSALSEFNKSVDLGYFLAKTLFAQTYAEKYRKNLNDEFTKKKIIEYFDEAAVGVNDLYPKVAKAEFLYSTGVPADAEMARQIFAQAADSGSADAMIHVGAMKRCSVCRTREGDNKAADWFLRAMNSTGRGKFDSYNNKSAQKLAAVMLRDMLLAGSVTDKKIIEKIKNSGGVAPKINYHTPYISGDGSVADVSYELIDSGGGIGYTILKLNGVAVGDENNQVTSDDKGKLVKYRLHLAPGDNIIEYISFEAKKGLNYSHDRNVIVNPSKSMRLPKVYALFVGVGRYNDSELDLLTPARDAQDFYNFFRDQIGERRVFSEKSNMNNIVLLNKIHNTDKISIENELVKFSKLDEITSNDVFLFYLSSHGGNVDNSFYIYPSNVNTETDSDIRKTSIQGGRLIEILAKIKTGKKLIVFDSCYSGALAIKGAQQLYDLNYKNLLGDAHKIYGFAMFASSGIFQKSFEQPDGRRSVFSGVLYNGLLNKNLVDDGGYINTNVLKNYIEKEFEGNSNLVGKQYPVLSVHESGFKVARHENY